MFYKEGDLVLAFKKYGYDSPHYEWNTGLNHPQEHAIVIKIETITSSYKKYYVKFIDGIEDCLDVGEMKFVASCWEISREPAAAPRTF